MLLVPEQDYGCANPVGSFCDGKRPTDCSWSDVVGRGDAEGVVVGHGRGDGNVFVKRQGQRLVSTRNKTYANYYIQCRP